MTMNHSQQDFIYKTHEIGSVMSFTGQKFELEQLLGLSLAKKYLSQTKNFPELDKNLP